jgi:hypothetical protein
MLALQPTNSLRSQLWLLRLSGWIAEISKSRGESGDGRPLGDVVPSIDFRPAIYQVKNSLDINPRALYFRFG